MIDALTLVKFLRHGKNTIFANGNRQIDRHVFYYLVDCVDLNSGLMGSVHKISNGRIADDVSEHGVQGARSAPRVFSRSVIRHSIDRLIDLGLLDRMSTAGKKTNLVLRACFEIVGSAVVDNSVSKKVAHKSRIGRTDNSELKQGTYGDSVTESRSEVGISNSIPSILPFSRSDEQRAKLAMSLTWQPSELFKKSISSDWSPSKEMLNQIKVATMGFKTYWATRSDVMTQAEWEAKLWKNELKRLLTDGVGVTQALSAAAFVRPAGVSAKSAYKPKAKLLAVPEKLYGLVLQAWAKNNADFRPFAPGESDDAYRRSLRHHIEKMNTLNEKRG